MSLPHYFFADLPTGAEITPAMIEESCRALRRHRERYLMERSTRDLIEVIVEVASNWLKPDYELRKLCLARASETGFGPETLQQGLDAFFRPITSEGLVALIEQDLGEAMRLDEMTATSQELKQGRSALCTGPELIAHIGAGNLPNPLLMSMLLGLLCKSAQFVKAPSAGALMPRLLGHSLYEADPKLGACLEIAAWPGGKYLELEKALFGQADTITATGGDDTLAAIQREVPPSARFVGHGSKVSFAYITSGVLGSAAWRKTVEFAARDVAAWNQQGCLSPQVIYVETGGTISPEKFAALLAEELERIEAEQPRGEISLAEAATISSRRSFYEIRAAHADHTRLWMSQGSTAWTVVFEADPLFQSSCLNRFIYVKSVSSLDEALQGADRIRKLVSTVGLAAPEEKRQTIATTLARWGATRVCPLGQMQNPPLTWRHDGRPALAELLRWTDWESE